MKPERWQQIKDLFQSAMDVAPERRSEYVTDACRGDAELQREVQSLLDAEAGAGRFIEQPVLAFVDSMIGRQVGSYHIERLLGHGGMGTVYLATSNDGEDHREVAIKMIRRGMDTANVIRRFRKEQQFLANLDHTNIARVFDGGTTEQGLPYFVMEYIEGQPIDVYADERKLSTTERLRLFQQVCAAVDSAHQKRIVHRDIKPSNILVTRDGQPKLLDFGIAKIFTPDDSEAETVATLTVTLRMMTPEYASPEQVRGERITPATDVYALGILLYELLTGRRPYRLQTRSAEELARVICNQEPAKPSTHLPIAAALDDITLKALRKEPSERYQTAADLAKDIQAYLEQGPVRASRDAFRYQTKRYFRRHKTAIGVAVLFLIIAAAATAVGLRWRSGNVDQRTTAGTVSTTATKSRPSIAVLGFKNLSNSSGDGWLSTALSEMFTTELAAGGQLRTIRLENVSRLKLELAVAHDQSFSNDTFSQFQKNLGADFLVDGSFLILDQNGQLRVDLRVSNTQQDVVLAISEIGPESDLFTIVSKAGSRLRAQLGLNQTAPNEVDGARAAFPQNPDAVRLYTEGLEKLRVFDAVSALPLLQKAAEREPLRPLMHSAISEAWSRLGYDGKAEDAAKKAYELTENFSRGERLSEARLSVEGRYREAQKDWDKAIDIYRTLWKFFPDDVEYGLRLAAVQVSGAKGKDALATVESLRQLPAPSSGDPRIDIVEGTASGVLSDYKHQQQVYAQAIRKARSSGAKLLLATAKLEEGRSFYETGQPEKAINSLQEAKDLFTTAGDRAGIATVLNRLAQVYRDQTDVPHGIQMFQESLAISREIGDRRQMATALTNLGSLFKDQGRFNEARNMHEQALALRREVANQVGIAATLSNIGLVLYEQDDLSQAAKYLKEALEASRQIGDRRGIVRSLHNFSIVKKDLGELSVARKGYEESLAMRREIGERRGFPIGLVELGTIQLQQGDIASSKRAIEEAVSVSRETKLVTGVAQSLFVLGDIALAEGDLAAARKHHEEALAVRKDLREERTIIESRLALANITLEEGRPSEAETMIRELKSTLPTATGGTGVAAPLAELLEARALLGQKKINAAAQSMVRAEALSAATQRFYVHALMVIAASRLNIAQKHSDVALRNLTGLLPGLTRSGAVQLQFETRLAQCEAEVELNRGPAARTCLTTLQKDSESRGFKLIARKAHDLAK
jgi:eukaryotic-like serine/threonine-protein kinase